MSCVTFPSPGPLDDPKGRESAAIGQRRQTSRIDFLFQYAPISPANILISLEWLHFRSWNDRPVGGSSVAHQIFAIAILFLPIFYIGFVFERDVLRWMPITFRDDPGISMPAMFLLSGPIAVAAATLVYRFRSIVRRNDVVLTGCVVGVMFTCWNTASLESFLFRPSY
jgi:hypothetical protein